MTEIFAEELTKKIIIKTDAEDETTFLSEMEFAISEMYVQKGIQETACRLSNILKGVTDIVCRMRGYKNDCLKREVIVSGNSWPNKKSYVEYNGLRPSKDLLKALDLPKDWGFNSIKDKEKTLSNQSLNEMQG